MTATVPSRTAIVADDAPGAIGPYSQTVYATRLERFAEINEAYGAFFGAAPPARVTIGVAALPKGASVEVDAVVAVA